MIKRGRNEPAYEWGEEYSGSSAEEGHAAVESSEARGRDLREKRERGRALAAHGKRLGYSQYDEQHRRSDPHLPIAGQEPYEHGRERHENDGEEERVLPPEPVAEARYDDRPEGTEDEREREYHERREYGGRLVREREEDLGEHDRVEAEDREVVPFEDYGEGARDDGLFVGKEPGLLRLHVSERAVFRGIIVFLGF